MRGRPQQYRDFTGGWNPAAGMYGLAENEAVDLYNVRPSVRGALVGRAGDVPMLNPTDLGSSMVVSYNTVASLGAGELDGLLIGTVDGKLWPYTTSAPASLGTFTAGAVWDFIDAPVSGGQGPMYGVNGTDAKQITTAPAIANWTAAVGTLPATAKYLAYVGNRVWAAGMSSYGAVADPGSALVFSNLGDPRDWPAANIVLFDPNDGEAITAIGEVGAGLLVFKRSKAWLVYDLDTGANRPLGVGVGCISHNSIQQTPSGTIFLGERNVWITDGTSTRSLSDKIEPRIVTSLIGGTTVNATSAMDGQRYLLAFDALVFEYDMELKSWWKHYTGGQILASARLTGETSALYMEANGALSKVFSSGHLLGDGSGSPLLRLWAGPYHTLGAGRERLRGVEVEGSGSFGLGFLPVFRSTINDVMADPLLRGEEALGTSSTVRRENDFAVSTGVQPAFYAQTNAAMQVDSYSLYVTRRPG